MSSNLHSVHVELSVDIAAAGVGGHGQVGEGIADALGVEAEEGGRVRWQGRGQGGARPQLNRNYNTNSVTYFENKFLYQMIY